MGIELLIQILHELGRTRSKTGPETAPIPGGRGRSPQVRG